MADYFGTIDSIEETERFTHVLASGLVYSIELESRGGGFDPLLSIYRQGQLLATDDDSGSIVNALGNARILFQPPVSGDYEFEVASSMATTGDYVLRVNLDDYRNSVFGVGYAVPVGGGQPAEQGEIQFEGDTDVFSTVMIAGLRYTVTQTGLKGGLNGLDDSSLRLIASNGRVLGQNDDFNGTKDSSLDYRAEWTGTFYAEAGSNGGLGFYRVDVGVGRATIRADRVDGSDVGDAIDGLSGDDDLAGNAGDDLLIGGYGADRLRGGNGHDRLVGSSGADTLIGGRGNDVFAFAAAGDSTFARHDRILAGGQAEAMQGVGRAGGDAIDLSALDANEIVRGVQAFRFGETGIQGLSLYNSGTDTVVRANTDRDAEFEFFLRIEDGAVTAQSYSLGDFVLAGDDFRNGVQGVGNAGLAGNGLPAQGGEIDYAGDTDVFSTQLIAGLRYALTQQGREAGEGSLGDPSLRLLDGFGMELAANNNAGGSFGSFIDYRATYTGAHFLEAGSSGVATGTYALDVGAGRATSRADSVAGARFADAIDGTGGNDAIQGGGGGDILFGGAGRDALRGQTGADTLTGGEGADVLIGGRGGDRFVFAAAGESGVSGVDVLRAGDSAAAFQGIGIPGGDLIDLEAIDADTSRAGDQNFILGRTGAQGLVLSTRGGDTLIRGNVDEDAEYEFVLRVEDGGALAGAYSRGDFDL